MSVPSGSRREFVISNSPVSFAIMGPSDFHRQILVRSDDKNLDLIGLDNTTFSGDLADKYPGSKRIDHWGLFFVPPEQPKIVRTQGGFPFFRLREDERTAYYSFAWRGLASAQDTVDIKAMFTSIVPDLLDALRIDAVADVEWQIAPLIELCHRKTNSKILRTKQRRATMIAVLAMYGLGALVAGSLFYGKLLVKFH